MIQIYVANLLFFIAHDFTFSSRVRGQYVPYGEAGDCYRYLFTIKKCHTTKNHISNRGSNIYVFISSTANCPQGRFSINLSGTGLRVSPYTGWVGQGNRPSLWLQRVSVSDSFYLVLVTLIHCSMFKGTFLTDMRTHMVSLLLVPPDN